MLVLLIVVIIVYPATIGAMIGIDWLTGGVISDAFGKEWPYLPRSFDLKEDHR